jgi:hypothetical protein
MNLKCLFGHLWISVEAFSNTRFCKMCSGKRCYHEFSVCMRCGKAKGFGSHGDLTVVPDSCKPQIAEMRMGVNYKGEPGGIE